MRFTATKLQGVFVIDLEHIEDERGFFARSFCAKAFAEHGLNSRIVQCSVSFSRRQGTLRGLHWQAAPHLEAKIVRVTRGAIFDVALDLRPDSPTFKQHVAVELTAENRRMLYVPEHCAHGFQTLEDNTEVFYQMSEFHWPESARGVRWNDPAFGINWPSVERRILSERDANAPDFP